MPNAGPQGSHRKSLAVKHLDGEPLTRADLQYDLLHHLFSNTQAVFTDPYATLHGDPAGTKVTFRDLYVNCLVHSPRCSKVSRDKFIENPDFGDEFAKISLLSNVGRINTTMAFFPEMRTALRTYHPVPSLQKTDGNLQDAPRIKNILKSCLLEKERSAPPMTPADVLARSRSGEVPPTTIVNLIFVFASHAAIIAQTHFGHSTSFDFLDFFCPIAISSESRARIFLWLCYHYLEAPSRNPFDDEHSRHNPGQTPAMVVLSDEAMALENVDPPDEKEWGERMTYQRKVFMANKDKPGTSEQGEEVERPRKGPRPKGKGKAKAKAVKEEHDDSVGQPSIRDEPTSPTGSDMPIQIVDEIRSEAPSRTSRRSYSPEDQALPPILPHLVSPAPKPARDRGRAQPHSRPHSRARADPYPRLLGSPSSLHSGGGQLTRRRSRKSHEQRQQLPPLRQALQDTNPPRQPHTEYPPPPRRSALEQAWHVITTSDPLADSEDEQDENARLDLLLRLRIINRLRGKEPTPDRDTFP